MKFEWDAAKAAANRRKHGVTFEEATSMFAAQPEIFDDDAHSDIELRFLAIGFSEKSRLLTVSFVRRGDVVRIISTRRSTKMEAMLYAKSKSQEG